MNQPTRPTNQLIFAAIAVLATMLAPVCAAAQFSPFVAKHLYSTTANPTADISAAVRQATQQHKRILLDFGGDWCGDCQLLNIYFNQKPNAEILAKHFIVVRIDIGHMDHNITVAHKYQVPVEKGVPAFAVLDSHGRLLFSQKNKEGEAMSRTQSDSVTEFLNKWKG